MNTVTITCRLQWLEYCGRFTGNVRVSLHRCGLAGSVVAEEGSDLSLIEPEGQAVHSQLVPVAVDLHQVLDVNTWLQVSWLLLYTHSWKTHTLMLCFQSFFHIKCPMD